MPMWRRGPGFAGRWWWGEADAFPAPEVGVAFAGGRLPMLGVSAAPTAVVVRLGERVLRLVPPLARAQARVDAQRWHVRVRSPRYRLELEGETSGETAHRLPVPDVFERRVEMRSQQVLAGRLRLRVDRGRQMLIDASSSGSRLASAAPLRPKHGRRERLGTHEAIERADHLPEHPQAKRCGAVDRLHASLRGQLRPAIRARCDPVREGHAHGAGLVPIAKGRRVGERGVVAGQGPDAPAEP